MRRTIAILSLLFLISAGCKGQPDSTKQPITDFDLPERHPTNEWEAAGGPRLQPLADSTRRLRDHLDSLVYDYFMAHIYRPAISRPNLPPGNRTFLDRLKAYVECPTDSCNRSDRVMRPVFWFGEDSLHATHRIVDEFPYEESDNSYDGSGWGNDTLISNTLRQTSYRVYYANAPLVKRCNVKKFRTIAAPCLYYKSYILQTVPVDSFRPAFCTTLDLKLEWGADEGMDSLLLEWTRGNNLEKFYCNSEEDTRSFAQLAGVPELYFGIDIHSGWEHTWESSYPTVGVFMKMDGKWAVPLWMYQMEMSACMCI
jgi:hypothetical protein